MSDTLYIDNLPQIIINYLEKEGFDLSSHSPVKNSSNDFTPCVSIYHKLSYNIVLEINCEFIQDVKFLGTSEEKIFSYIKEKVEGIKSNPQFKSLLIKQRFDQNEK